MGIKKFLSIVLIFSIYLAASFANAQEKQTFAVVTVDAKTPGSTGSIYTRAINMVSADITNKINSQKNTLALNDAFIKKTVKYADLTYDYETTLKEYKINYSVNYERLERIAKALNADKIIFVTGGFDVRQYLLRMNHPILTTLELSDAAVIKPSYKFQVFVAMIDPYQKIVLWTNSYEKYLPASSFDYPSSDFAENIVPIAEVKKFSEDVSKEVASKAVFFRAADQTVTSEEDNNSTSTMIDVVKKDNLKDEITTKDGHSYSTQTLPESIRNRKINEYKNWMKNKF